MATISYAPSSPDERVRRRRVLFSDYNAKRYKEKPQRQAEPEQAAVPKGHCAKCGQHIGRGVKLHEKRCDA